MKKTKASVYTVLMLAAALVVWSGCSRKAAPSDAQIASEIQDKIYSDSGIQSRQIEVQAAAGVATLSGTVSSDTERTAAANDAAAVAGVKTVVNNLTVQQAQTAPQPTWAKQRATPQPVKSKHQDQAEAMSTRHHREAQADMADANNAAPPANNTPPPPAPVAQATPPSPQPPPPPQKVTIPAGTQLTIRLNNPLDSERNQVGDSFHGSLSTPIVIDGQTVIPSGADVVGRVADVRSAGRFAGNSVLTLELTSLSVNGRTYNIQTNQWTREGKGEGKNTATKVGVGTAAGAILGGIFGGGKGAAIGAATGAGAGTATAAARKGQQIQLPAEAVLNFQTINVLTVQPQSSDERNAGRSPVS